MKTPKKHENVPIKPNIFGIVKLYRLQISLLVVLTIIANGLNLFVPKLIANGIDAYSNGTFVMNRVLIEFLLVSIGIFVFTYLQNIVQTYASERVARDLRLKLITKISRQDYMSIQEATSAKLLTNLTADVDAIKNFVAIAIATIISSVFLIFGSSILLLRIDWKLACVVLLIVPLMGATMVVIFGKVRKLFKKSQEAVDWLNKVINESILGSSLIRLLNSEQTEYQKFIAANTEAKNVGLSILRLFASLIPIITFATNGTVLVILVLGGHFVMTGSMSLGGFTAFYNYLAILIFPIIILGFISNVIAQASVAYARIGEMLDKEDKHSTGTTRVQRGGDISLTDVSVLYGEKYALKDVSFVAAGGSKTAIIGPTAAGKTQLLYLLTGLINPMTGAVEYNKQPLTAFDPVSLHQQIAFVFQDSVIFNLTLRENIAFSNTVKDEDLQKAIATAELTDFIAALPEQLDTVVSERGTSLSGGQKQRIMLARALALNPSVLLLDDFTSRVDSQTEQRILKNVEQNYPGLTLISVTQKVSSVEHYDKIIVLMEGELIAQGTHEELLTTSPEYVQIFESQHSINQYELLAE